jgi:uncharacterized membrane protein YqjE
MATPYGSEAGSSPGLLQSFKAYVATWVELLKTRVELLTTELQEERERTEQIVFLAATAAVCLSFGALLVTLFVVVIFWETNYRLMVLGALALLYLAAGLVIAMVTRHKARNRPKLLSATVGELTKDFQSLSSRL